MLVLTHTSQLLACLLARATVARRHTVERTLARTPPYMMALARYVNQEEFSDVVFIVGASEERVYAHQLLLSAHSPVFRCMFTAGFRESQASYEPVLSPVTSNTNTKTATAIGGTTDTHHEPQAASHKRRRNLTHGDHSHLAHAQTTCSRQGSTVIVRIPNIAYRPFLHMLEFIYTGDTLIPLEMVIELYSAADQYMIEGLMARCTQLVAEHLTGDKVWYLLVESTANHAVGIRDQCWAYLETNATNLIVESDEWLHVSADVVKLVLAREQLDIDEFALFCRVLDWVAHQVVAQSESEHDQRHDDDDGGDDDDYHHDFEQQAAAATPSDAVLPQEQRLDEPAPTGSPVAPSPPDTDALVPSSNDAEPSSSASDEMNAAGSAAESPPLASSAGESRYMRTSLGDSVELSSSTGSPSAASSSTTNSSTGATSSSSTSITTTTTPTDIIHPLIPIPQCHRSVVANRLEPFLDAILFTSMSASELMTIESLEMVPARILMAAYRELLRPDPSTVISDVIKHEYPTHHVRHRCRRPHVPNSSIVLKFPDVANQLAKHKKLDSPAFLGPLGQQWVVSLQLLTPDEALPPDYMLLRVLLGLVNKRSPSMLVVGMHIEIIHPFKSDSGIRCHFETRRIEGAGLLGFRTRLPLSEYLLKGTLLVEVAFPSFP